MDAIYSDGSLYEVVNLTDTLVETLQCRCLRNPDCLHQKNLLECVIMMHVNSAGTISCSNQQAESMEKGGSLFEWMMDPHNYKLNPIISNFIFLNA